MHLVRANADLCTKSKAHTIAEARAAVPELTRRVYAIAETICDLLRGGNNGIGVVRAVGVDVIDC